MHTPKNTTKRRSVDVSALRIRTNLKAGESLSLAGIPAPLSFASIFRDELAKRGLGFEMEKPRDQRRVD